MKPVPTGKIRNVEPHELFFSTTDAKGVIALSNDVFSRLSCYDVERLHGSPHNIVRHPRMPASIFTLMWERLQSGKPFAGYMYNLAGDGSEYDVFATVTPLPTGGYLSVRSRIMRPEVFAKMREIYARVLAHEESLIEGGLNRRQAAEAALPFLVQTFTDAGIASYHDFELTSLPEEVELREKESANFPHRSGESQLHQMLAAVEKEHHILDAWMRRQDALVAMSQRLAAVIDHVRRDIRTMENISAEFSRATPHDTDSFDGTEAVEPLLVWNQMQGLTQKYLATLITQLDGLQYVLDQTRFRIALSRLHSDMCGVFLAELIDTGYDAKIGVPGAAPGFVTREVFGEKPELTKEEKAINERLQSLEMLSSVLSADVEKLQEHSVNYKQQAEEIVTYIDRALRAISIPRQLLQLWQMSTDQSQLCSHGASVATTVAAAIDYAQQSKEHLLAFQEDIAVGARDEDFAELSQIVLEIHAKVLIMQG